MTSRIPALFDMFGVEYDLVSGWEARTSGTGAFDPRFIIDHHTAPPTPFPLSTIIHGSRWRDIPGPLSQFLVRQSGLIHVVGRLRANHAGQGTWGAYLRAINDEPPRRETSAGTYWNGNYRSYGFEQDHPGDGVAPWPDAQLEATARANAALCWHYGWTANRCIAHGEWTSRKFDPHPISYVMKEIRTEVARLLAGEERKDMSYRRMVNDAWLRIVGTHVTGQSPETAQMRLTRLADELKAGPGGKTPSGGNGRDLASLNLSLERIAAADGLSPEQRTAQRRFHSSYIPAWVDSPGLEPSELLGAGTLGGSGTQINLSLGTVTGTVT